jgi:DNA-binding beta-propeller fold protein YncE
LTLRPNSVGFVDAASGRVTKSFPVGRQPEALLLAHDSVWAANFRDQTLTRIRTTAGTGITIPVGGHPTGLAADDDTVWVLTLEGSLVPIDPRYDRVGNPARLSVPRASPDHGRLTAGGGFLWATAPGTTVIRVDPAGPRDQLPIVPDSGARGPLMFRDDQAWVAGSRDVTRIAARSGVPESPISVGAARGLAFGAGSLWVVSGGPGHAGGVKQALRRVDVDSGLVQTTIRVGSDPVDVAVAGGSVWVASRSDRALVRVDAAENRVVETLRLDSMPVALAADEDGVWVATG